MAAKKRAAPLPPAKRFKAPEPRLAPYQEPWSERETRRFLARSRAFQDYGLGEAEADQLADQLLRRDRPEEGDDRRVCWECQHFKPVKCFAGEAPMPWVLQRCPSFQLKDSK